MNTASIWMKCLSRPFVMSSRDRKLNWRTKSQIDDLMVEHDEYKVAYAEVQLCSHVSTVESTKSSSKSEKVPDPPLLTDGKGPKFKGWMIEMEGKFMANADHFNNDQMK